MGWRKLDRLPTPEEALPGRDAPLALAEPHMVNGSPLLPPYPDGMRLAMFGLGLYDDLLTHNDSPVVALNRAAAVPW